MGEIRRVNLSLNLSAPHQREAWKLLRAIPARQRTNTVCRALCRMYEQDSTLEAVRQIIREELGRAALVPETEKTERSQAGDVDDDVLGFLRSLQGGDDNI